jgi:hypothetical protein
VEPPVKGIFGDPAAFCSSGTLCFEEDIGRSTESQSKRMKKVLPA